MVPAAPWLLSARTLSATRGHWVPCGAVVEVVEPALVEVVDADVVDVVVEVDVVVVFFGTVFFAAVGVDFEHAASDPLATRIPSASAATRFTNI